MLCRRGTALLELVLALALTTILLTGLRVLLLQCMETTRRIHLAGAEAMADANAERLLESLFLNLDRSEQLDGSADHITFRSWCANHIGWQERCSVALSIQRREDTRQLSLRMRSEMFDRTTRTPLAATRFVYLLSAADGGEWLTEWSLQLTAPLAVGVITGRDTLILRIGLP